MLNGLWLSFFVVATVSALAQWLVGGNAGIFSAIVESIFAMAKLSVEVMILLFGTLTLWLGFRHRRYATVKFGFLFFQRLTFLQQRAVRRVNVALKVVPGVKGFNLKVVHAESLHSHDAVAQSCWNWSPL